MYLIHDQHPVVVIKSVRGPPCTCFIPHYVVIYIYYFVLGTEQSLWIIFYTFGSAWAVNMSDHRYRNKHRSLWPPRRVSTRLSASQATIHYDGSHHYDNTSTAVPSAGVDIPAETVIVHVPGLTSSRSPANDSHSSEGNEINYKSFIPDICLFSSCSDWKVWVGLVEKCYLEQNTFHQITLKDRNKSSKREFVTQQSCRKL